MAILKKATVHAEVENIGPHTLIDARLAPDVFPLARQVQTVSDAAKSTDARLTELEVPGYTDTETIFNELQARIVRTVGSLEGIREEQLDGAEERNMTLKVRGQETSLNSRDFLFGFVLSDFFLHVTTAYATFRHNGVKLGKMDFLGGV